MQDVIVNPPLVTYRTSEHPLEPKRGSIVNELEEMTRNGVSRRSFVTGVGAVGVGVAATSLLAGCGSGGRTISVPTAASFANRSYSVSNVAMGTAYDGTAQFGTISLVVGTSGTTATGTLILDSGSSTKSATAKSKAKTRQVTASVPLTGTLTSTGAFALTGTVAQQGQNSTVTVTGTLPTSPATTGGTITVNYLGASFTSTFNGGTAPTPAASSLTDFDILNFALNLEYLEAEFYLRAAFGTGLAAADIGTQPGPVTGGSKVAFVTPAFAAYAAEIAMDEQKHVQFLRAAIKAFGGTPVDRPAIDLTNSFNAAAAAAGLGSTFNPFDNENDFLVGAFTFEDVGVTAYHGAAALISNATVLSAAAGILGTEAYHAGEIRTIIASLGGSTLAAANAISALRSEAGGGDEVAVSGSTIAPTDSNALAFARTPSQVLHIVYNTVGGAPTSGGFFPNGMNGRITAAS